MNEIAFTCTYSNKHLHYIRTARHHGMTANSVLLSCYDFGYNAVWWKYKINLVLKVKYLNEIIYVFSLTKLFLLLVFQMLAKCFGLDWTTIRPNSYKTLKCLSIYYNFSLPWIPYK